ncbi:MAG: DNA mismatch repair endonuclease MutL [Candidatus Gracilibacteria bacterium]|jgi:DNA mismatch repair protein MutL
MQTIHLLPQELISQIAAGEVIERPASAVKELVENAIDSGATQIGIEIEAGGLRKIRVVDNGCGMTVEDARLAFTRHATSKIVALEDLLRLRSLGFRGEALASIASIARVNLKTRRSEDVVGTQVEMDGGREELFEPVACSSGSDFTIYGLFEHTPARRKYMKSESTEYGHIFDLLCAIALAHSSVGFRLKKDGVEVFDLPAAQSIKDRVRVLFGGGTANALLPLRYDQSNFTVSGYIGKPELARATKKYQYLFVNGRCIENRLVSHAVKEAFHSLLMHEKNPWFIVDIQMDPALVDCNVHPRKLEVRFVNSQEVHHIIFGAVKHALENNLLTPLIQSANIRTESLLDKVQNFEPLLVGGPAPLGEQVLDFSVQGLALRPLVQIARSYIVAESEEGLVLIDQHAAHERVRYERLMHALENKRDLKQVLLTPLELDLGVDSQRLIRENREDFAALGFEFEEFGGSSFVVRSIPAGLEKRDPERVIQEILADFTAEWKQNRVHRNLESLATMTACRGAIKFGDTLTLGEMQALVKDMQETKNATHCPHGRPSMISFSYDKLETLFKRRNF